MNKHMDDSVNPNGQPTTAVSIFDEAGASGDFPVLKAFQQYIDAEQAKARKRMVWLSAFFVTLLIVVVVVFSVVMATVISRDQQNLSTITARNQELSDKLLDVALKSQQRPPAPVVPAPQPPPSESVLKPVLEKLENLATAMTKRPEPRPEPKPAPAASSESVLKPVLEKLENLATAMARRPEPQPQPQPVFPVAPPVVVPQVAPQQQTAIDLEAARLREDLKRLQEEMQADKARQEKAEAERRRLEEVERHRRRLYPEYYAKEDARKAEAAGAQRRAASPLPPPPPPAAAPKAKSPSPVPAKPVLDPKPQAPVQMKPEVAVQKPVIQSPVAAVPVPAAKPPAVVETNAVARPVQQKLPPPPPSREILDAKPLDLKKDKPISYFAEDDEDLKSLVKQTGAAAAQPAPAAPAPAAEKKPVPPLPQAVATPPPPPQPAAKAETLNVGAKGDKGIPFVIELPESK